MECVTELTPTAIAARLREIGVSAPYASQIAHRKREPSPDLAVKIAAETGLRLGFLAGATDDEVEVVARLIARRAG